MITGAGTISIGNLRKLDIPETNVWDPVFSPDGTRIAYVAYDSDRNQQIFVINPDGTGKKKLTSDTIKKWGVAWGPEKIAYVSFDKGGLEKIIVINPDGTENKQLIPDDTRQGKSPENNPPLWAAPSWSTDGKTLLYTSLDEMGNPKMYTVNADGTGKKLVFNDAFKQWSPSWSPDGKNIVYASYTDIFREELFIVDAGGTARRQLTFDEIKKNYPVWGPDGTIMYVSYENVSSSNEKLFAINHDGTDKRLFIDSDYKQQRPSWSHDGRKFSYVSIDITGALKIAVGDTVGIPATPTPTATATAIQTVTEQPSPEKTPAGTPAVEEQPAGLKDVVMTMLLVLAIIVTVMFGILVISNILSRKK